MDRIEAGRGAAHAVLRDPDAPADGARPHRIVLNAFATRAGGALHRVRVLSRRAPAAWNADILVIHTRHGSFPDDARSRRGRLPLLLDALPPLPRRIFEAPFVRGIARRDDVRAVLHYGTYVPLPSGAAYRNILCFTNLAPWQPGAESRSTRSRMLRALFERTRGRAHRIITESAATRDFLCDRYPDLDGRLVFIPNGYALPSIPPLGQRRDFVLVGDVHRYRRLDTVIRAYGALPPCVRCENSLLIAGDARHDGRAVDAARTEVRRLGLDANVHWVGVVPHGEAIRMMAAARAFVSFAAIENGPNAVIEAAALGTPLILSDIEVHREIGGPAAGYAASEQELTALLLQAAAAPPENAGSLPAADTWDTHVERLGAVLRECGALPDA